MTIGTPTQLSLDQNLTPIVSLNQLLLNTSTCTGVLMLSMRMVVVSDSSTHMGCFLFSTSSCMNSCLHGKMSFLSPSATADDACSEQHFSLKWACYASLLLEEVSTAAWSLDPITKSTGTHVQQSHCELGRQKWQAARTGGLSSWILDPQE